jgi:transcriptional regulator GlxA family with amidase domain
MDNPSSVAPIAVALAVADSIPIIEVAAACDIFGINRPDVADPWYDFFVCASDNAQVGSWFRPDGAYSLDKLPLADTVIVPAVKDPADDPPAGLVDAVRQAYDAGARIVSLCTGAFVLAAAGILDGRRATTHWMHCDRLAERYPKVDVDPKVLYIDEGNILTSAGKAAGIDLCLHLVRLDHGAAAANAVARQLVMPPHRDGGQVQFIAPPALNTNDHALSELLPWITANLDQPLTVAQLARRASMSTRNLARHFKAITGQSPLQWLLMQRIYLAQELLETTDYSVDRIAEETGMTTAATLRRHFNRAIGVPPDTYRRTFRERKVAGEEAPVRYPQPRSPRPALRGAFRLRLSDPARRRAGQQPLTTSA